MAEMSQREALRHLGETIAPDLGLETHIAIERVTNFAHRCTFEPGAPSVIPGLLKMKPQELVRFFVDSDEERIGVLVKAGLLSPAQRS